jgi:hypothetical protein
VFDSLDDRLSDSNLDKLVRIDLEMDMNDTRRVYTFEWGTQDLLFVMLIEDMKFWKEYQTGWVLWDFDTFGWLKKQANARVQK